MQIVYFLSGIQNGIFYISFLLPLTKAEVLGASLTLTLQVQYVASR